MQVIFKMVKVAMPHCGDCGDQLKGKNSQAFPYRCSCGAWETKWENFFEYVLKGENQE